MSSAASRSSGTTTNRSQSLAALASPRARLPNRRIWSEATIAFAGIPPQDRKQRIDALASYLGQQIAARRTRPTDDLITALVEAEIDSARLDDAAAISFCMLLLVAGNETTTGLIGNCLLIGVNYFCS
jgi:cytochrome P450